MKAKIRITLVIDLDYPVTEGETEYGDLNSQLADFHNEFDKDPLLQLEEHSITIVSSNLELVDVTSPFK